MSTPEAPAQPQAEPPPVRLLRTNWVTEIRRTESGVPTLPPSFVVSQGRLVELVDVRDEAELEGPLGHVPGVRWVATKDIERVADVLPPNALVVLISRSGDRSATAAKLLEARGMTFVASMEGGMLAWRNAGYAVTRDPSFRKRTIETLAWSPGVYVPPADGGTRKLALSEIQGHVGDPRSVRWVKMSAFLTHGKISCVDGRDDHGVVGTPGGDAGELLLALAATELVTGRPIGEATLGAILERYLDTFGHLYLHTDTHALNKMILAMRADPRLADELPPRETQGPGWRKYMARPPAHLQALILEHLIVPDHIGCGHIRLMFQNGEAYGVRQDLVRAFLRAYYTMRWSGSTEAEFVVLGGGHQEGAVVSVRLAEEVYPFTLVPLVSPACGATQMFVAHPDVTAFLRRQIAAFMTMQKSTGLVRADRARLYERMTALGERQLTATLGRLAKGLPHYVVRFEEDQSFGVF
ncbi:rhodanese-like domain-containing protein [Polyangium sp. 6x1]|uniref:rhodanese-like domain-containing protein n=1 Tax=Polyangium sp. 6x1 TaxID=3042689 RepID=UPI002482D4EC|nr:rhodanese-like domain-containing protein [Polyangium sp. 6x1]MDI1449213.1 rhodanese-like domain-containing protein [Polyangium sp. 6x1]